jgi:hypothetical protein
MFRTGLRPRRIFQPRAGSPPCAAPDHREPVGSLTRPPRRPGDDPWTDIPGQFPPGEGPILRAADTVRLPARAAGGVGKGAFPRGIFSLPATALSCGPCRPRRLVYRDATVVDCRDPGGGPPWTGITAGVTPAAGSLAPGWLQLVLRGDDDLLAVHPALMSPWSVDPLAHSSYREEARFRTFDLAEAAGLHAAGLAAIRVDRGDHIFGGYPIGGGPPRNREVIDAHTADGTTVIISSVGSTGSVMVRSYLARDSVEVVIPPQHPGETGKYAPWLFGGHHLSPLLAKGSSCRS